MAETVGGVTVENDLISRAALISEIKKYVPTPNTQELYDVNLCIVNAPAIGTVPVRHGRWIEESDRTNHWHCSNCGFVEGIVSRFYNYCPNCGAKMDGGEE